MDAAGYARVSEVFVAVAALTGPGLAAALERECAGDAELRAEVESLLAHHAETSLFAGAVEASPIGRTIGGIFVERALAEGGMGTVYLGRDERLRRPVALKAIRGEWRGQPEVRARFRREARVLSQLRHPNICEIYSYEETPDSDYLVLEYIDGKSLQRAAEGLTLGEKDRVAATLAEVLQVTHAAGVVHRDLKPDNVMLTTSGELKVLDFGVARVAVDEVTSPSASASLSGALGPATSAAQARRIAESHRTEAGELLGTPRYMAPEQARGEAVTPASDVFALGLILHELYSGRAAYPRHLAAHELLVRLRVGHVEPPRGLSRERRRLVEWALAPDPAARPTATEVALCLRRIRGAWRRRLAWTAGLAGLGLAALAAGKYVVDVRAEQARTEAARRQAEALVDFLLVEVHDEVWASARREVVERVTRETLRYFEELPESRRGTSGVRMARALRNLGIVTNQRGDRATARAAVGRARGLDEQALAAADAPEATRAALEGLGHDLQILAGLATDDYDLAGARALSRQALAVFTRLAALDPDEPRFQDTLALSWEHVAWSALAADDFAGALAGFEQAAAIYRTLLAAAPEHRERRFHLGDVLRMLGECRTHLGADERALADYRASIAVLDALAAEAPEVFNYVGFAAEGRVALGRALTRRGALDQALAALERAHAAFARNHERDPSRRRWPRLRAAADLHLARALRALGREHEARARLERAAPAALVGDESLEEKALWLEVQLELGRGEAARPTFAALVELGWHRSAVNAEVVALARRQGLVPAGE